MATDIQLKDLTNGWLDSNNEWQGNGIFDVLIQAVNKNIESQYNQGRIDSNDYATVYLGGIQSVIAQSMQFLLQEKQAEAQTDLLLAQKTQAELDGEVNRRLIEAKIGLTNAQTAEEQYKVDNILPSENAKLQKEITLLNDQDLELLANGVKDRELKDKQISKTQEEIDLLQTQDSELQLNGTIDRELKAAELAEIHPTAESKRAVDTAQIALLTRQESEAQANGVATRDVKAKDVEVKTAQTNLLDRQRTAIDDGLLKDILKEASGGYAMVYEAAAPTKIPGVWAGFDSIVNELASRAGYTTNFTETAVP